MNNFDRITVEPDMMNGQPCVRGMRLTVRRVVLLCAEYPDRNELFSAYPDLEEEDIQQCLRYAGTLFGERYIELPVAS